MDKNLKIFFPVIFFEKSYLIFENEIWLLNVGGRFYRRHLETQIVVLLVFDDHFQAAKIEIN
jgi:hypothetical protein